MKLFKLLINDPQGIQRIIEVEESGKTSAIVLWDERFDGPMDQLMLDQVGGYKKLDGVLVFDQVLFDDNEAKKDIPKQNELKKNQIKQRLKGLDKVASFDELKPLLKDLVDFLGL